MLKDVKCPNHWAIHWHRQKLINRLGADVLRLWVASTDYSGELNLSEEILKTGR